MSDKTVIDECVRALEIIVRQNPGIRPGAAYEMALQHVPAAERTLRRALNFLVSIDCIEKRGNRFGYQCYWVDQAGKCLYTDMKRSHVSQWESSGGQKLDPWSWTVRLLSAA